MSNANLNNELISKQEKFEIIESTLNELNMSKEELIELIRKILEAEISLSNESDKNADIAVNATEQKIASLDNIDISSIAEKPELLEKYFSENNLKNLVTRFSFALSVQKLKELKNKINLKELEKILQLEQLLEIDMAGKAKSLEKEVNIPLGKQEAVNKFTDTQSKKQEANREKEQAKSGSVSSSIGKFFGELKQALDRTTSKIQAKINDFSPQAGIQNQSNSTSAQQQNNPNNQNNPNSQQRSANIMSRANELSRQMRRLEQRVRRNNPEVKKVSFNGRSLTATVERPRGRNRDIFGNRIEESQPKTKEVNLNDYLNEQGKSSPDLQKELDINLKKQKELELDIKIQQKESEVSTLKGKADSLKLMIDDKGWNNSSSSSRGIAITPDSLPAGNQQVKPQAMSNEALAASQPVTLETDAKDTNTKGKKEALRTADQLVRLDAIGDRQKMMSDMKNAPEMKDVANNMKKIQADLKEAEQNKDLLKEMKNQRFQDKFIGK
ncbi:MAG TPA: hypothetical protein DIV86_07475 [Alphaproteobacteria bacterium]|nr:hypothetical protein [Alphaproteobacteria bacterium]